MKNLFVIFMITVFCFTSQASVLESSVNNVIENGWRLSETFYSNDSDSRVNDASIVYSDSIESCAQLIAENNLTEDFAARYADMDEYHKILVNPVVDILKEYGADTTPFPGYGYPEPGYNYRRGLEIRREFLSAFWRNEERLLETNQENELTIEIKFLADFTNGVQNQGAGEIKSMETVNVHINGELKEAVRIKYVIKKSLKVRCTVKFQKTKAWFELFKQKKAPWYAPWQNNAWEKCGETYTMVEEATGEAVANDAPHPVM